MLRERLQDDTTRKLALLGLIGAAIRFAFMPFTLHFDAYQIYSRAAEAAYHNQWFGFTSQFLIQELHNLWLLLIRPLLPDSSGIWSTTASTIGVGASQADYERFLAYDHIYRLLFLMKLPYVVADLACAWVLTRLVEPSRRVAVAAFWLLNPLVIFSSAIYGRHDAIAILLVLLSLLVVRKESDTRRVVALGLLGVATLTRFFPVVIVPLFLLAYRRTTRQLLLFLGMLFSMAALVEVAGLVTSGKSTILTILSSYEHFQYWFDAGLYLRFDDWIFLFPVAYTIFLLWVVERGVTPREYPTFSAVAFLLLFSLTFFHPHYAVWLVPFLALTIPPSPKLITYHAIQVVCVLVYSAQWGSWTTWNLFEPILGARVASLPDPVEAISGQIDPRIFFGLFRSILTAVSLWMAWLLVRNPTPQPPPRRGEGVQVAEIMVANPGPVASRSPSPRRGGGWGVGFLVLLLTTTACTTRVTGYESPVAHDYFPVQWQPLVSPVEQTFVAGPGYAAAFADDPKTTPAQLQQRWAALPEDARTGSLADLRVGVRESGNGPAIRDSGARLQMRYDPVHDLRFPEQEFHTWDAADVWLPASDTGFSVSQSFVSPYALLAGITIRIATFGGDLSPGEATVGTRSTAVRSQPVDGAVLATLLPGAQVAVTAAAEGWTQVQMPDGMSGFVPLDAFAVLPPPQRVVSGPLALTVRDGSGAEVRSVEIASRDLHDNSHLTVPFDPLPDSAGAAYTFTVSVPSGVTLRATAADAYADGSLQGAAGDLVFRPVWSEQPALMDVAIDTLPRDGDWVRVTQPPEVESGHIVSLRLVPGDGNLEYGTTPDRMPYGGWMATADDGVALSGALLVETRYDREVAVGSVTGAALSRVWAGARNDALFAGGWLLAFVGMVAAAAWLRAARPGRSVTGGR